MVLDSSQQRHLDEYLAYQNRLEEQPESRVRDARLESVNNCIEMLQKIDYDSN